jgi:phytanoyl-CoA hydroxylase
MRFQNSVASQGRPWFMDPEAIPDGIAGVDADIRPYVEDLIRDGVTVIKKSVSRDICSQLIAQFKQFSEINSDKFEQFVDAEGHYPRIINLHCAFPELFKLFSENQLAYRVQEAMFRAKPCLYTSLFYERGSAQPPHRDSPVFTTAPEHFYFGVWVALEDANAQNGALQVFRGGHALPELDREAMALRHFDSLEAIPDFTQELWAEYQDSVTRQCEDAGLVPESLCVEAGDTVIWHPQLPHGGGPIEDITKSRFSFVMHTTPVGVPVYHQDVFFNPRGNHSLQAKWEYREEDGKMLVDHEMIDFAHKKMFDRKLFEQLPAVKDVTSVDCTALP